jgi:nucleoid DNA-binding protein
MRKKEISEQVSNRTGAIRSECEVIVNETFKVLAENIAKGEVINIRGLFNIILVVRANKAARNITKGENIVIPAHYAPKAKFAKEIIDKMKELPIK